MTRIAIIDRADMNAEQARVYDAAKQSSGIVGGPYLAYIRLPKLFEAGQNLRASPVITQYIDDKSYVVWPKSQAQREAILQFPAGTTYSAK